MSLLKKIGSAVGKVAGKVVKGVANVVDNVAKKASGSNSKIVSAVGKLVDGIIPDKQVEAMASAAARDGEVKVAKVEETVTRAAAEQGVTDPKVVNTLVHETAKAIAEETDTTINDKEASVKVTTWEKVKAFCKKYAKWLIGGGAAFLVGLIAWLTSRKGGKKRYRR